MKLTKKTFLALMCSMSVAFAQTNTTNSADTNAVPPPATPVQESAPAPTAKAQPKPKTKSAKPVAEKPEETGLHVDINPPETAVVKQDAVNVRGRASFVGEVITKLKKGESVTLLEEITLAKTKKGEPVQWYRIAMPSATPVWVNTHFIDSNSKSVVPSRLNVRAGPGENFSVIGSLEKGSVVKEIRTVNDWIEIEPPADTYAFVAADLIDRNSSKTTPGPAPVPEVEVVAVPPVETNATPVSPEIPAPAQPVPPVSAPDVGTPPPVVAPAVEEPLPRRVVTREGIVRRSLNVQTPSYFALEHPETHKTINYLYNPQPGFTLKPWVGTPVVVTGEEIIDKRWPNTPVIEVETIDQR